MKNFLKSSVSALVLLSIAANLMPAQAGNKGGREENPEGHSKRPVKKVNKNKQAQSYNFEETAKPTENLSILYHGLAKDPQALQRILFCRGIDPETTKNTALVCKNWHGLIKAGKLVFRNNLMDPKIDSEILQRTLKNTLLHPSAFALAHEILAPNFPYQNIYSPFIQPFDGEKPQAIVPLNVPKNIEAFASFMRQSPHYHPSLGDLYANLDPLDFKTVALVAHTTKDEPHVQKFLWNVIDANPFEIKDFPELMRDANNHPVLKKHLMALKLLTLCEDPIATPRMAEFEKVLSDDFTELLPKVLHPSANPINIVLNGPLWSVYCVNTGSETNLRPQLQVLNIIMRQCGKQMKLEPLEGLAKYTFALGLELEGSGNELYYNIDAVKYLCGQQTSFVERLALMDSGYKNADKRDLPLLTEMAEDYSEIGHYPKAMEILKDVQERVGESSFRFQVLWVMAELILDSNDQANFPLAEANLKALLDEFERVQEWLIDTEYTYTVGEGDEKKTINAEDNIEKLEVLASWCALQIYRGEFKAAYKFIKEHDLTGEMDFDLSKSLMKALQVQHSAMPSKLKDIFKDELLRFSWDDLHRQKFINENEEVFGSLLKGHPLDKRKFKKDMKSIRREVQPDQPVFEEKGKEEESVTPQKALSASSNKDKKHDKVKKEKKDKKDKKDKS